MEKLLRDETASSRQLGSSSVKHLLFLSMVAKIQCNTFNDMAEMVVVVLAGVFFVCVFFTVYLTMNTFAYIGIRSSQKFIVYEQ